MTPKLSEDQRLAIREHPGVPVYVVDAETNEPFVLLSATQFEKMKAVCEPAAEFNPREAYPFVDEVMTEDDANDPALATYQSFSKPKR